MAGMKRVVQRYECSQCGWRWSRDFKAPMSLEFPQPSGIIMVPRNRGPCECEPPGDDENGE
jgi:transposase-like protein